MCILCAARKWCRRGAAMLPWLVIPLVGLWALSGLLLPPRLRIELTSPRLACVLVLFATLFWYEIIVPRLSVWRSRHSARLRERRLSQAIELQKLRKTATRRCRNCLTPYRDQNPGCGARFMCANCGHVSKRPILDLSGGHASSNDLAGKNGFVCSRDWAGYKSGSWVDWCSMENLVVSACRLLLLIFSYARWAWRKTVMIGREDDSSDKDNKGFSSNKGDVGENSPESRSEKARRKAEEKRQARLEKEMLEAEERKQREEVARLVEERRKLRDEVLEAEKESLRRSASVGRRDNRKGSEKRRQESRKEKDKGSSKSNSDCEELEKRASREREGKHAFDKKNENDRRVSQKTASFDSAKVPFQTSPRSFRVAASVIKASKPVNGFDYGKIPGDRKDAQSVVRATGKFTLNGGDRKNATNFQRPVELDVQPRLVAPKRSWLQLFTRSSGVSPCLDADITISMDSNSQLQPQSVQTTAQMMSLDYSLDNDINLGQSLHLTGCPSMNYPISSNPISGLTTEYIPPFIKGSRQGLILDDLDVFEDPCFVPDPISLLSPVSESLDKFPLDLGPGFMEEPCLMRKVSAFADVSKPSPIESPLSRLRVSGERHSVPGKLPRGMQNMDDTSNANEPGTWQMWGSPLAQNGLGLVGASNWFSPIGLNKSNQEDDIHSLLHDPVVSHVAKENTFVPVRQVPQSVRMSNYQNGGMCSPHGQLPDVNDLWVQRTLFQTLPADGDNYSFPLSQMDNLLLNEVGSDSPSGSASSENPESSPANCWSKRESPFAGPSIGDTFSADQDVHPVWSFNLRGL